MLGGVDITLYNNDWFLQRIRERRPYDYKEYEFLDDYKGAKSKLKAVHKTCGNIIDIIPNTFISRGSGCPKCAIKRVSKGQMKTQEQYEEELLGYNIESLENYKGAFTEVEVHCKTCSSRYSTRPHDLLRRGCTRCLGRHNRTIEEVKQEFIKVTNGEYLVKSDSYISTHEPIEIEHTKCGSVYSVTRHNFRKGRRCPICNSSLGEMMVAYALDKHGINYERQKTFVGLEFIRKLSYDFYIPENNLLIEYQGIQHYEPVEHFGGEPSFLIQEARDKTKRNYAFERGINLLEIPYAIATFDDVEAIVLEKINELVTRKAPSPSPKRGVMI